MKLRLSDTIYEELKKEIKSHSLPPEKMLTEQDVAERFSASRSPARAALTQLASEGYIIKHPQKGYSIVATTHSESSEADLRQLRSIVEVGVAVRLILVATEEDIKWLYSLCEYGDDEGLDHNNREFHLGMAGLLNNPALTDFIESLIIQSSPTITDPAQERIAQQIYKNSHKRIVDAIKNRDIAEVTSTIVADIVNPVISC